MRVTSGSTTASSPQSRPSNPVSVFQGGGAGQPNRTTAFEHRGQNYGRVAAGQLDSYANTPGIGLSYSGLVYESASQRPAHEDGVRLSAEALSVDVHSVAEFSERSSRIGAGLGLSLANATAQTTLGDERNNVTLGLGLNAGFGVGFDLTHQRNDDGSQTFGVDLGLSLGGRLDVSGQITAGALSPEDHAERERTFAEQFPEGLGGA